MVASKETLGNNAGGSFRRDLLPALQRLDHLLEHALAAAEEAYGSTAAADPYRGLYLSLTDISRSLAREPGTPTLKINPDHSAGVVPENGRLAWLASTFGLSEFDLDVVVIALAPEIDLRYERLYGYLQDDVTRRKPSIDLALNLLCATAEERIARRAHFASDSLLVRHGVVHLVSDPQLFEPPLLAHSLKLDEQITRLLLGHDSLDARLASFCELRSPAGVLDDLPLKLPIKYETKQALLNLNSRVRESQKPLRLYFQGARGVGRRETAEALATEACRRLLSVDLRQVLSAKGDLLQRFKLVLREAVLQDAILYFEGADALRSEDQTVQYEGLLKELSGHAGSFILAGALPWITTPDGPTDLVVVCFPTPDFQVRQACWRAGLAEAGIALNVEDVNAIADSFRFNPAQIRQAIDTAQSQSFWETAAQGNLNLESPNPHGRDARATSSSANQSTLVTQLKVSDLFAAARAQCGHDLAKLTRKVEPKNTWRDIVLPLDQLAQLREICDQARYRQIVYGEWGFDRKLSLGKGLNVLFAGPPGTGKTMAAEVIACELQLDLYKIDLSQVVSKYIGETEKNLDRIFTAAENANAILFFDEADALFGKRSEVKDSHDRYANIEIGYLLQKMEEYEGIAILATNLRQNLDGAFVRRIQMIVEFPFPDEEYRERIWKVIFPREVPIGDDVDFHALSRGVMLAGGNIKNIALAAAFYAAADGRVVRMDHLAQAAHREHQKLGRTWNKSECSLEGGSFLRG